MHYQEYVDTNISGVCLPICFYTRETQFLHTDQPNLGVLYYSTGILHVKILKTGSPTTKYQCMHCQEYVDTNISGVRVVNFILYPKKRMFLQTNQPNLGELQSSTGILHVKILKTGNPATNFECMHTISDCKCTHNQECLDTNISGVGMIKFIFTPLNLINTCVHNCTTNLPYLCVLQQIL